MRKIRTGRAVSALIALALAAGVNAQTIYVDDSATGANNGSSWADAYTSLQSALAFPGAEVLVAEGSYTPGVASSDSFNVPAGVTIVGGWAGAADPDNWNPGANLTTLSGGGSSAHVVTIADGDGVVLDGLVITGGFAPVDVGAGVYIAGGSPTLQGCVLAYNSAPNGFGAAVYAEVGVTIDNCILSHNDAARGGAVYVVGAAMVTNTLFDDNTATLGGAICRVGDSTNVTIDQCEFRSNTASEGGAILFLNTSPGPQITGTSFYGNSASFGGAVGNLSGGMSMVRCIFNGNDGTTAGGAVTTNTGGATVTNCTFEGNTSAVGRGISLTASDSTPNIRNCIFWDEVSGDAQIAIYTAGGAPLVNYSCVKGQAGSFGGTGNIDADPLFEDVDNKDFSLTAGSPCINAGDPSPAYNDLNGSRNDMGAIAVQNAMPMAVVVCEQLTDIGQTAEVRLDGSGSSDPDDITDDLFFEWSVDGNLVSDGYGEDAAVVEVSLAYGVHEVTLLVTDPDGAYDEEVKTITVSAAALSLLEAGKVIVNFKDGCNGKGTFSICGEIGLPYGVDYTEVARKADVAVTVAGVQVAAADLTLSGWCGGWHFWNYNGVGGLTRMSIDWNGAKFEYKEKGLTLRSDLISSDETVLTVKYNMKKIGGPFALTIDGLATLTVNAQGVASADVPMCVDDHGKEVTLKLPFAITDSTTILIVGPPYGLIDAGDYLTASIGRFCIEGKFNSAVFPAGAATTPRKVELSVSLGDEGYAGATTVGSADLAVKKDKWQAK